MRILSLWVIVSAAVVSAGCPNRTKPSASEGNVATPGKTVQPQKVPPRRAADLGEKGKWDCTKDTECLNSCSQGAVNRAWYQAHPKQINECEDGCDNQISGPPRCLDGQCVAFDNKGKRRPFCTRKPPRR